jgi:hypothetical protein
MTPTQDLFLLIKSLSKAEKRYIKLDSVKRRGSDFPDYITLFDAIDKQKEYDEAVIRKRFKGHTFIKRLPETKYYLYETILKNLRTFHTKKSIDMKLREMLDFAELLYAKQLYDQCNEVLNKATKYATIHGHSLLLLEIKNVEAKILSVTKNIKGLEKLISQIDQGDTINKEVNTLQYTVASEKYYVYQSTYFLNRDKKAFSELQSLSVLPMLQNASMAITPQAKLSFHRMRSHYYGAICDYDNTLKARLECVKTIEHYPAYLKHHLEIYKSGIYMLLIYAAKTENIKVFHQYYERFLFCIKKMNKEGDPDMVAQSVYLKNYFHIATKTEKERIEELTKKYSLSVLKKYTSKYELTEVYFIESMAVLYFHAGYHNESLFWLNKLLNRKQPVLWLNVYSMALKLNILVHFELANFDILPSLVKHAEQSLIKSKIYFEVDRIFIRTFKNLAKKEDKKDQQKSLLMFKKEILVMHKVPFEKLAFYYFDYLRWIDKRLKA